MTQRFGQAAAMVAALLTAGSAPTGAQAPTGSGGYTVPVEYYKLDNGLKVVLSARTTASPVAIVGGLLQHRLPHRAEGSHRLRASVRAHDVPGLGASRKMEFIALVAAQRRRAERLDALRLHQLLRGRAGQHARDRAVGGGRSHARPRHHAGQPDEPAGRGAGTRCKVNVLNQPYGGFPWLDIRSTRTRNWYNAHNFYGDLARPRRGDARRRAARSSRPTTRRTTPRWSSAATSTRRRRCELVREVLRRHSASSTRRRSRTSRSRAQRRRSGDARGHAGAHAGAGPRLSPARSA